MNIDDVIKDRLSNIVKFPKPYGNIIFVENPDTSSSIINLIWDVGFQTPLEAVMFQHLFITLLANIYFTYVGESAYVTGDAIFLNIPDESGTIITPTTQVTHSKIYPRPTHYKGQISLELVHIKTSLSDFLDDVESSFTSLLEELNFEKNKI